ncbi:DUF4097 domain-containing protein [Streptomyces sp. NBC_01456]|uniref:DUF4097 family beta strand repeat-containing protein n=1 Tax=unclassified Streptomyces TaxID=2593676 RepID=UPI002E3120B5|nr:MULTISPECIES: DUF4097 family beta strand repeat-containing protein [unclassified Streptomyces]
MPEFATPGPLSVTLAFDLGSVRITAGKRTDTVVEVLPSNPDAAADIQAAEQTEVTCSDGKLLIKGPRKHSPFGRSGSLAVRIELPAGSDLVGSSPMADFHCTGPLGECRLTTSLGDIQVDEATAVHLRTDHGDIRLDRVTGDAELLGSGRIDVGEIAGAALVKNVNGATILGEVTGPLRAKSANGALSVGVAHDSVDATSANGAIRIGEVARGRVDLQAAAGDLEIGIRQSTAAWLDVHTDVGSVRTPLGPSDGPGDAAERVEVRAHTAVGDIVIHRA